MMVHDVERTASLIQRLEVQGARNIALSGVKALGDAARKSKAKTLKDFIKELERNADMLSKARVTEPALRNGLEEAVLAARCAGDVRAAKANVAASTKEYAGRLSKAFDRVIDIGVHRIRDGDVILTHCHSSTVTNLLKAAHKQGKRIKVFCTETRPKYQGRITAKELTAAGIPTTMIVDSCARTVMNDVDLVLLGADAFTSDGFLVNKVGTSQIALVAKEARTMLACACETMKFDPLTLAGSWEPIEERSVKEVWDKPPKKLKIFNPAFDLTPPHLLGFVITELGVISPFEVGHILRERQDAVKKRWEQ
ncbi:MAG: S-methyl-5-thioribose-1-phosphate isomerase [Candidatus Diapherotrites archaeon]|nr:S-methyl-5-thioribose-1-phosphate isomerase [Candidatus Diapherotrites archaeon]